MINIDGFNELLVSSADDGLDISMPLWQALVAAIDKDSNRTALVPFVHEYLRRELLSSGDRCPIAARWALYHFAARYVEHRRAALPTSHSEEQSFFILRGSARDFDAIAKRWVTGSLLMQGSPSLRTTGPLFLRARSSRRKIARHSTRWLCCIPHPHEWP